MRAVSSCTSAAASVHAAAVGRASVRVPLTVAVTTPSSVGQLAGLRSIDAYPNPAAGALTLDLDAQFMEGADLLVAPVPNPKQVNATAYESERMEQTKETYLQF